MERWSFDCQMCGCSIGDYAYVDEYWYVCPQKTGQVSLELEEVPSVYLIMPHTVTGRGWGRFGYSLCVRCATKSKFKCPICGLNLIKINADRHPGGHWGIRGEPIPVYIHFLFSVDRSIPKREPAPMW